MQGRSDRLAADPEAETLAQQADETLEGEAWRRVGAVYGWGGRRGLGGAHGLAEAGLDVGTKGGRPPVRR